MRARADDADPGFFRVNWHFVPESNRQLPVAFNSFASSHFDPDPFDWGGIGEVRQVFYPKATDFLPGFLTGKRFCGKPGLWADGWPASEPALPYSGGVTKCCLETGVPFNEGFDFGYES